MSGFDLSGELIEKARSLGNHCWTGDMRELEDYRGKYDVVLSWFTSFGYFDDNENIKVLKNFYASLNEGGIAIIDVPNSQYFETKPEEWTGAMKKGDFIEIEFGRREKVGKGFLSRSVFRHYRDEGNRLLLERELRVSVRIYHPDEMADIMRQIGFREVLSLETMTFRKPTPRSSRITYVGVK